MLTLTTDNLEACNKQQRDWIYNGLDCCITLRLYNEFSTNLMQEYARRVYDDELRSNDIALHMTMTGMAINTAARDKLFNEHSVIYNPETKERLEMPGMVARIAALTTTFKTVTAPWLSNVNWRSPLQLKELFYTHMFIEPIYSFKNGERKVSTDREALLKIRDHDRATLICNILLRLRDLDKMLSTLSTELDIDQRLRSSYKVAATETGRWASAENAYGTGTNGQNITKEIRKVFITDPGYKFVYIDLEQAESYGVACFSNDPAYLQACLSGDLHTTVCKLIWPNVPWTGNAKEDRALADAPYYRHFSRRDLAKRAGHGSNYKLGPHSLGRNLKIHLSEATKFQLLYFGGEVPLRSSIRWEWVYKNGLIRMPELDGLFTIDDDPVERHLIFSGAFPGIRAWHDSIALSLQTEGSLETPFQRRRRFWGDTRADSTLREAVAFMPQSTIGDILNEGLRCVYKKFGITPHLKYCAQIHDAALFQVKENMLDTYIPQLVECMRVPVTINGHHITIPVKAEIGDNWKDLTEWTTP